MLLSSNYDNFQYHNYGIITIARVLTGSSYDFQFELEVVMRNVAEGLHKQPQRVDAAEGKGDGI